VEGVTVRLAGPFSVHRGGVAPGGIGAGKAHRLLVLLAVERHRLVPTDRIIDGLWGGLPPRRPAENVATLVSRLRVALGPGAVEGGRHGYRLGRDPAVRVDLDDAARLVAESQRRLAEGTPVLAATAATAAMEVLGDAGVLTDQPDADWVQLARTEGATLLRAARLAAAAAACQAGDPGAARTAAEAAVGADPLDEAAHRLLMTAHQLAGEPSRALADYERLRVDLATELGADPDPQTRQIHLSILREHPATPDSGTGPPRPARDLPGLVGRAAEITLLTDAWSAACARRASVLLLAGEGGIGKTRLAAEIATIAEATGGFALQSRCYASERSLFLQPFVDALSAPLTATPAARLRELAGPHAPGLVGLFPVLESVLGHPDVGRGSAEFELRRAYEAVTHVLTGLAADRPALLVLDDLHNAGLATIELLHYLARHLVGTRLLVLGTIRVEEGEAALAALADVTVRADVGPLPAAAVAHMVAAAGLPEHAETIARRSRGHTLFVVETLRALAAGEAGAPPSLQQVVLARLRRTGPATEELLRAGAVLGATVDPATVADMVGLTPQVAAQRCAVAAAARLLVVAGRNYEFANDLIQEVLYATTPEPTRVAYHRRAAELLSHRPELVATHAVATQDWPLAARALLLAAEEATRRFAIADARDLAERALDAAERGGAAALIAEAYLARGHSWVVRSEFRLAFNDHHAALVAARQAGDTRLEMLALRELGGHAGIAVSMADAAGYLADGFQIAEALGDRGMQARFLDWLAVGSSNRLRFVDALAYGRRAVAIGRASGEDAALAAGLDGLKNAYAYLGWTGELAGVLSELVPLLRRLGDAALLQWAVFESAFVAFGAADWGTAEGRIGEAITISERSGHDLHAGWFTAYLSWLERLRCRYPRALDHGRRAIALTEGTNHRWFATVGYSQLGIALLETGRTAEAIELLTRACDRAEPDGAEAYLLRCLAPLAEATGSPTLLAKADALLDLVDAPAGSAWLLGTDAYLAVARGWLRQDEPRRARTVLAPLLGAADRHGWVPAQAAGAVVDGLAASALGDVARARTALCRAAELGSLHGMPGIGRAARAALSALR
jgi:DNA-binding SARP family transcriptional activator/tetratricopeptide (TPR) repeat protein